MSDDKKMIQASEKPYSQYRDSQNINFDGLYIPNADENNFISREGVKLRDVVGRLYLTGNDLLHYPKLAAKLRAIKEYPLLERVYPVDRGINGAAFIEYFHTYVLESLKNFQSERAKVSDEVNALIELYGNARKTPLIDGITEENTGSYGKCEKLIINGLSWYLDNGYYSTRKPTERLSLRKLFNISSEAELVQFEDAVIGTPFIALRVGKTWQHKGCVNWYSLDTRQPVPKSEVLKK